MGCSGSAAGNAAGPKGKKVDDNKVLRDAGLQPLTKPELALFNGLFAAVCAACKPKDGEAAGHNHEGLMMVLQDDQNEAQKHLYERADADMDEKLNKEECAAFLKSVLGEGSPCCTPEILDCWNKAMACLDSKTGAEHSFDDFCRSKGIMRAWIASAKGDCLRPAPAAPIAKEPAAGEAAAAGESHKMH